MDGCLQQSYEPSICLISGSLPYGSPHGIPSGAATAVASLAGLIFFRDDYVGALRDHMLLLVRPVAFFVCSLVDGVSLCISFFLPIYSIVPWHGRSPSDRCARYCCPTCRPPPRALPAFSQITMDSVTPTYGLLVHRALISLHPPILRASRSPTGLLRPCDGMSAQTLTEN